MQNDNYKSDYLDMRLGLLTKDYESLAQTIDQKSLNEITSIRNRYDQQIEQRRNAAFCSPTFSTCMMVALIVGVFLGFAGCSASGHISAFFDIIFYALIGGGILFVIFQISESRSAHSTVTEVQRLEAECKNEISTVELNSSQKKASAMHALETKFAEEKKQFKEKIKSKRDSLMKDDYVQKVSDWVISQFDRMIQTENRANFVQKITVPMTVYVSSIGVDCVDPRTCHSIDKNHPGYDFKSNRIILNDSIVTQVAFAQAICALTKREILKKYPYDFTDKYRIQKSSVAITHNDTAICLTYHAYNGNYKQAYTI